MGWPQFLAWAATQGFKNIKVLRQAYNSFKGKLPGKDVILKTAKNLYDDVIKKTSTKDLAKQIRQKDKLPLPKEYVIKNLKKEFPNWKFKKVPPSRKGKVVNIGDRIIEQMQKQGKTVKFDDIARIYKKKPPTLKADGGSIDKALSGRSRDI